MKQRIKSIIKKMIPNRKKELNQSEKFKSGHYYSVIPSLDEIKKREKEIFSKDDILPGIELNHTRQIQLLEKFSFLSSEKKFSNQDSIRFNIENDSFSHDDAPILHYMLRYLKPKRVIEIGSGNSSAVMLDTSDLFLEHLNIDFTFIDLNLGSLRTKLQEQDYKNVKLIEAPIQSVDLAIFKDLQENDLLFIDSSHVSKIGSDLNTIIFKILPLINSGVHIHFHDIRFPFDYQKELVYNKVFWNEAYILRSFLMYNNQFEITFWLNYLLNSGKVMKDQFDFLPLDQWDRRFNNSQGDFSGAGGSLYLKKL
jgi:predicted O-methyltransferase YrrM